MATVEKPSARETKRLQTRERLMGAAIAEFKRGGMADADVGSIVTAAGVAHDLSSTFKEAVRLVLGLERRLGASLFKDFLALHFSQTRPADESKEHPVIVRVAQEIERAQRLGHVAPEVVPVHSAVFFLLGLYALLTTTHDWPTQSAMLDDYVASTLRSLERSI
jgi:hypothetical protein